MAGYRPADWHPLDLDRDPTPGDPQRVRTLATQLHSFADDVSDALGLVKGMAGEDTLLQWAGKSAEVFKEQFKDVPKNLKKLKKSYELCGDALADYWPKLERAQALADKALAKAKEAQSDLSSAKSRLSSADSWVTRATKEADKYKDDPTGSKSDADKPDEGKVRAATRDVQSAKSAHTQAQSDVTTAQNALDAAKKMAEDARKMRDDAAGEAKRKIDEASDAGIPNRHWWQDVGHWFEDNWDTIVTVCKVVVAVVGIIAMIIGGPILGAIVLVAALVVLADTLYKYSQGQASLWDVAFAALDCIPGGKGITSLGKLAKGLKEMKNLRGGMKAMSLAVRGLGKNARGMLSEGAEGAFSRLKSRIKGCGDPVDVATGAMFLGQADIELPGILPLVFSRRVASDYHTGWWFGPSWSSTVDQRLEADEDGIVFVTEDGLLLHYDHPQDTDAEQFPSAGPRWPLKRLADGGYRIEEPLAGLTRDFARLNDGVALLTRIVDRNAHTIDFDYDGRGTPLSVRHSGGYHLCFATEEGRITSLSLVGAGDDGTDVVVKRYAYTDGNLTDVTNSSGLPLRFTYDERLRISSWTDTNNSRYSYAYDEQDRCISQGGVAGHLTGSFSYNGADESWPGHSVTMWTDAEGSVSTFVVDGRCDVVAEKDPLGNRTFTSYDEHGHLSSVTDALGNQTRFVNNQWGRPTSVAHPDGSTTNYTYDACGKPSAVVLPDGNTWLREYDDRGNCTAVVDPTGVVTSYTYDRQGRPTSIANGLGEVTRIECSAVGSPVRIEDPLGNSYSRKNDAFGRPVEMTDPLGHSTFLYWTLEGRLARRVSGDAEEQWEYDGEGNLLRHVNAQGAQSAYEYSHFDLMSARTDPGGFRYEFDYDSALRLTGVTNPQGRRWEYRYDSAGRLISETDFDGACISYAHDPAGRLVRRTNAAGQEVHFERNQLGQTVTKCADETVTRYGYDSAGRLISAETFDVTLRREYDAAGRLAVESADGRATVYGYDVLGRRVSRVTPSGVSSSWLYDAAGRRVELYVADKSIGLDYDAVGRETACFIGNFLAMTREFDPRGRLKDQSITTGDARLIQRHTYTYRSDDVLVRVDDLLAGTHRFDLDETGRITGVDAHNWSETYAYDATGNQVSADWPAQHPGHEATGLREYEGTRVTRAGRVRYEHDAQGRVVLKQRTRLSRKPDTWRYDWDAEDRLLSVRTPDGSLWRYVYDPLGRRIAKQLFRPDAEGPVERTAFTWDGATLCEQTSYTVGDDPNTVTLTWEHQGTRPVSQTERICAAGVDQEEIDSRFFAIVTDLVGTPTALVDENGEISWHARSTVWGKTVWRADSTAYTPLRFPGQYYDPESGLHYNYFRYYDPETARYVTSDPLGLTPGPNPFAYVGNPFSWIDPLGLSPCSPGTRDDALLALDRAEELQSVRNDYFMADVKGTTAVIGVFNSETKQFVKRIGINGSGPMPSSWTLKPGEEFVQASGHAEEGILNSLGPNEHAVYGAASRNFCNDICLPQIDVRGIEIGGEGIRGHMPQNSPYTLFWTK
ncbi:RHS repeat-associated core domain-containing protein [Streptomyces sp. NPDC048278]|uniref:RHS repeat-associated core domain-containing protein n=1 Tax=Streptomyces sp. NPDC048278 TaxID=3155809 RepID=UPI00343C081E